MPESDLSRHFEKDKRVKGGQPFDHLGTQTGLVEDLLDQVLDEVQSLFDKTAGCFCSCLIDGGLLGFFVQMNNISTLFAGSSYPVCQSVPDKEIFLTDEFSFAHFEIKDKEPRIIERDGLWQVASGT